MFWLWKSPCRCPPPPPENFASALRPKPVCKPYAFFFDFRFFLDSSCQYPTWYSYHTASDLARAADISTSGNHHWNPPPNPNPKDLVNIFTPRRHSCKLRETLRFSFRFCRPPSRPPPPLQKPIMGCLGPHRPLRGFRPLGPPRSRAVGSPVPRRSPHEICSHTAWAPMGDLLGPLWPLQAPRGSPVGAPRII